jgi:hypothetical protein
MPVRAYDIVVRNAKLADEEQISIALDRNQPWVRRVVQTFFRSMAYGWAFEAIESHLKKRRPIDYDVQWFLRAYQGQDKNFEETGYGWKDPGREEVLEAVYRTITSTEGVTSEDKTILPDELDDFYAEYGILECA